MQRIAASALWLTYYAFVNPMNWLGYLLIELADWLGRRTNLNWDRQSRYDDFITWLYRRGIDLEGELFEWWHAKLMKTGFAADMLFTVRVEGDEDPVRTWHQLTRWPWQRPFSQRIYRIEHPETVSEDVGFGENRDFAIKLSRQLV